MKNNLLIPTLVLTGATSLAAMLTPVAAKADSVTYTVNRTWSSGSDNASLAGTVGVPLGNYTLTATNNSTPFTNVNLTLTVNGTAYNLNNAYSYLQASGKFHINAGPSELTFNTSDTGAPNYAFLGFFGPDVYGYAYSTGTYDQSIERAFNDYIVAEVTTSVFLPLTFGTAAEPVPEPLTMLGTGVVLGAIPVLKKEYAKKNKKKNGDA